MPTDPKQPPAAPDYVTNPNDPDWTKSPPPSTVPDDPQPPA